MKDERSVPEIGGTVIVVPLSVMVRVVLGIVAIALCAIGTTKMASVKVIRMKMIATIIAAIVSVRAVDIEESRAS